MYTRLAFANFYRKNVQKGEIDMKQAKPITKELQQRFAAEYDRQRMNQILTCAVSRAELPDAAYCEDAARKLSRTFTIDLTHMKATSQKSSGRCWIFAAMNVLREAVAKKCGLEEFELSQNYIAFWDKFEKINYFLESIIDTADLPVGDRTLDWILQGVSDGGQWDMVVSLIQKYGVVPKTAMPETTQSSSTRAMSVLLNMKLREDAIELRGLVRKGADPQPRKEEMLGELYQALCICFGRPADIFDFSWRDKQGVYHCDRNLTPHDFYEKYVGIDLSEYVSLIHAPTADKPYGRTYTVKYLGNVVEGAIRHLNVPMDTFQTAVISQLKDGEPVWFGCDCSKFGHRKLGIWDQDTYRYGDLLGGLTLGLSKENALDYRDSTMNHAMVIVGVNLEESGTADRWKIENSWGDDVGDKGYYVASAKWFDTYVYQAVVHRKYLSPELQKALEEAPIELEPWDPMGSLADENAII